MSNAPNATPNIHLYIWPERFLYVGPSKATTLHRNHAAVWLTAPIDAMHITLADNTVLENQVVYLPSGIEYATQQSTSHISALYWEPESDSFKRIAERFENIPRAFRCPVGDIGKSDTWQMLQNPETTLAQADELMSRIFAVDLSVYAAHPVMDARIQTALAFLRESPQHYDSIDALADKVHLSPSRFAHLFKTVVGVPVRRYVLWMKLRRALDIAISGSSLTTAALSAGFADSAHLSRTVRAMMGFAPEFLFRNRERLIIHH